MTSASAFLPSETNLETPLSSLDKMFLGHGTLNENVRMDNAQKEYESFQ